MKYLALLTALALAACHPLADGDMPPPDNLIETRQHAVTYVSSPYGSDRVDLYVGKSGSVNVIVWVNADTGACQSSWLSTPITGELEISAGPDADIIHMGQGFWSTTVTCAGYTYTIGKLSMGSSFDNDFVRIRAGGGGDVISSCGGWTSEWEANGGITRCLGEGGNDAIYGYGVYIDADGGADNDVIWTNNSTIQTLRGDTGDDCLQDTGGAGSTLDCGTGSDKWKGGTSQSGCETGPVSTCI